MKKKVSKFKNEYYIIILCKEKKKKNQQANIMFV